MAFVLLRTLGAAWTEQVAQTPNDRVVVRNKLGWNKDLPVYYSGAIRAIDGVKEAVGFRWAGLFLPAAPGVFFESFGVETQRFLVMHGELSAPAAEKEAFLGDRRGAFVSADLAKELGWKLGDKITFRSRTFQGSWELRVLGLYHSTRYGFAQRAVYFHWDYLNDVLPASDRSRFLFVAAQIRDPHLGARLAKAVDIHFDDQRDRTFSQEDKALNAALIGQFGAILDAMNLVSWLILGVVFLVLGNTVAMGVREQTREHGALRAIGFRPPHIVVLITVEAMSLGFWGGVLAVSAIYPLLWAGVSRFFEENLALPGLELSAATVVTTVALGLLLGFLSGFSAARGVAKGDVVDALRYVG